VTRPLEGRVAVVTGGSRGIGRGIALRLARDGADCAITYRKDAPAARQAVAELEALGVRTVAERLELPGRIVLISGIDSFQAMGGHGMLGAAKAAAESLVRGLALELGPRNITVNAVTPGFVKTDSSSYYVTEGLGLDYERATARLLAATPVGVTGPPEDVAALVAYLVSDAASFLTGQCIVIDGGLTITSPLTRMEEGR
jgi:NAD(P)-dependent dehydrogenase (short-subunit alcohol dehydrogenase family)